MTKLKKRLSLVLALVLLAQLCLPVGAVAAGPAQPTAANGPIDISGAVTIDISGADGYIAITDEGYKIGNATEETPHTGPYILKGNAKATNARILTHTIPVKSHILVKPRSNDSTIDITLKDVDISLSGPNDCAFTIISGGVNLTLSGKNILQSGGSEPGLWVGEGMGGCGSLTITGKSTDSLTAIAGSPENSDSDGSAGIGGRPFQTGGTITIGGGMVTATGGIGGAGIGGGGGSGGYGGTITIGGGTVNATGGSGSVSGGANSIGGIGIGRGGAGIGGGGGNAGGEITINGGTVDATGSKDAKSLSGGAGIGGGGGGAGGTITITGGNVNATGGSSYSATSLGDVGEKPGGPGAGIGGGGDRGAGGTITISGGSVNANGGSESPLTGGAGIGGGYGGAGGAVTVTGGVVSAFGGSFIFAGIGDGDGLTKISGNEGTFSATGNTVVIANEISDQSGHTNKTWRGVIFDGAWGAIYEDNHRFTLPGNVTIPGGYSLEMKAGETLTVPQNTTLTVEGHIIKNGGSIIENGRIIHPENILPTGGINISKGDVLIDSSCGANCLGHVITGNNRYTKHSVKVFSGKHKITLYYTDIRPDEPSSAFTISSGAEVELTLVGDNLLGGNREFAALTVQKGGKLTITKESTGTLNAISTRGGAGIGGDSGYESGTINIEGGMVKAAGNGGGAGIGGGWHGAGGTITIDGDAVVVATSTGGDSIGNGNGRTGATVNRTRGIIFENKAGTFYGDHVTLNANVALYPGEDLTIPSGKTLTIPSYKTLTNHANLHLNGGTLFLDGGTLVSDGTLGGYGTFKTSLVSGDIVEIPDQAYTGQAITPDVKLNSRSILGQNFTVTAEGFTKSYENNTGLGTAMMRYTRPGYPTVEKAFNIVKSGTTFEHLKTYKDATETNAFTYGDTITVKAKPVPSGEAALMAEPGTNQMALFLGDVQLCEPVNPDKDGVYTMTYHTAGKALKVGRNDLTAQYVGDNNMADFSKTVTVTLNPKPLTATVTGAVARVYDGNPNFHDVPLTPIGVEGQDAVTATANGSAFAENTGTRAFTASAITLGGANSGFYSLDPAFVSGNVTITPATPSVSLKVAQQSSGLLLTATSGGVSGEKPNGNVVFTYGSGKAIIATVAAVNGVASYQWNTPPAGSVTVTANFGASSSNYSGAAVKAEVIATVDKQEQTALVLTPVTGKTYGDGSFALSTTGGSGGGLVRYTVLENNGVLTISGNTATIVGVGEVTVTATKAGDDNYNSTTSAPITITIGAKPVTVTVTAQNKVYDGTTDAQVSYMVSGTVGADTITAKGAATFDTKNVGAGKTITATGIELEQNADGAYKNYTCNTTATTEASITPKPLTWGTSGTVQSKPYDGNADAVVDALPTLAGMAENETVVAKPGTVTFANANVGTHAMIATGFGLDNANYTAPAGQPVFESGSITPKSVASPTISIAGSHIFNGKQQIPVITVEDDKAVIPATDYTVSYGDNVNVKDGGIVAVTLKGNYSGSGSATFEITKATTSSSTVTEPILMTAGAETAYSIPLPEISNAGAVTYLIGTNSNPDIFAVPPTVADQNLTFSNASTAIDGQTSQVIITVQSENYNDFDVTLTFAMTGKVAVALTGLYAQNSTYTGQPQQGYGGDLVVTGGTLTADDLVYTYAGIGGTTYDPISTPVPVNVGSYKLTIAVTDSNHAYTGSHEVITFTIAPQELTVNAGDYKVTKVWNGTTAAGTPDGALAVTGVLNSEKVSVTATPRDYLDSAVKNDYTVTVDLALNGTDSGNYALVNSTLEVPGTITTGTAPGAPAPKAATVGVDTITLQPVAVDGETVEYGVSDTGVEPISWKDIPSFTGLNPNTEYHFFTRVAENTNHPAGTASKGTPITTAKKVYDSEQLYVRSFRIVNGSVWETEFTLDMLFSSTTPPAGATLRFAQKPGELRVLESIEIVNDEIRFKSKNNPVGTRETDAVTVTVSTDEYQDFDLTIVFPTREKVPAVITATMDNTVYTGEPVKVPTSISAIGDGVDVTLTYTYQWKKGDTVLDTAPRNAGDYTLIITGSNGSYVGSLTLPFTINKKPLTVTAGDAAVVFGGTPTFTNTPVGLAPGETLADVTYTCSYNKDAPDPGMARTAIIPQGGKVSSGNGNYAISYVPGTLTINPNKDALTAAIAAAEALKSGVEISDKTPDEETYGKRFVTSQDMTALENAIESAKQVAKNALAPQEIADAMNALTQATTAFQAAIQTGTYGSDSGVTRYTITATAGDGGSISPDGAVRVQRGGDKVFAITPKEGYVIADVLVDGVSVGAVSSYTFSKVAKAHTISATFRQQANPYADVSERDWFYKDVQSVTQRGLMTGVSENRFDPYGTATRGTIATVLYRQAGSPSVETDGAAWYAAAQAWAKNAGVSDGENMDRTITRQELVTMLHRYAKQMGLDVSIGENTSISSYNDASDLPQWSIPAFQWACAAGIVTGVDGSLLPNATATRAEVATMLQRFANLIAK